MVDKWHTLGFVLPHGDQFLEVEADSVPYVFAVSPAVDFGVVPQGEADVRGATFEVVAGSSPITLQASPLSGSFTLVSPNVKTIPANTGPQEVTFLVQYIGGSAQEEAEMKVSGLGHTWTIILKGKPARE